VSSLATNADSHLRYPNTRHPTRQPSTVGAAYHASQCGIMVFLTNLPNELLVQIFCSLSDIDDALHFGRTCTAINHILESPEFYLLIMRSIIVSSLSKDQSLIYLRITRFHRTHIVSIFDYAIFWICTVNLSTTLLRVVQVSLLTLLRREQSFTHSIAGKQNCTNVY